MSEFTCSQGHLMLPSLGPRCHICGAPCVRMDGMTNKQLAAMEREDERSRYLDDEEEGGEVE